MHVTRSIEIAAPQEKILPLVADFRNWPQWSPWLVAEPETQLRFSDDGKFYRWEGKITGTGEVRITDETLDSLGMDLVFIKPFPASNRTGFRFEETGTGTRVTWTMDGSLPFFLFFMVKSMTAYVGADFARGLLMLKDLVELGHVPSKLDFTGLRDFPGAKYIGRRKRCAIAEIGTVAGGEMTAVMNWLGSSGIPPLGEPLMICSQWDVVRGTCEFIMAVPADAGGTELPDGFMAGELPACRNYEIRHTGAYRHLGNAWTSGMMRSRTGVFKMKRGLPPFETYGNDPTEVDETEISTVVHFPAR